MFSCRTQEFCLSCHAKRVEAWGKWMRKRLLFDVPHSQIVFTKPKRLRLSGRADPLLAAYGILRPPPGPGRDQARGRAGGEIRDQAGA